MSLSRLSSLLLLVLRVCYTVLMPGTTNVLRLDSALQGYVKFQYKSAQGMMDEVYKYPCTCGGTPPPVAENEMRHAHRIPDEKYAGEVCGGTIMLMVGEDNALVAYGIQGQRIAVDIVH